MDRMVNFFINVVYNFRLKGAGAQIGHSEPLARNEVKSFCIYCSFNQDGKVLVRFIKYDFG